MSKGTYHGMRDNLPLGKSAEWKKAPDHVHKDDRDAARYAKKLADDGYDSIVIGGGGKFTGRLWVYIKENTMKLTDMLEAIDMSEHPPEESEDQQLTSEQKKQILTMVAEYNSFGKYFKSEKSIQEVAQNLSEICDGAHKFVLDEADDWFDKVTINRNMKDLSKLSEAFSKSASEGQSIQQRLHALYEDMGVILNRYFEIAEDKDPTIHEAVDRSNFKMIDSYSDGIVGWVIVQNKKTGKKERVHWNATMNGKKGVPGSQNDAFDLAATKLSEGTTKKKKKRYESKSSINEKKLSPQDREEITREFKSAADRERVKMKAFKNLIRFVGDFDSVHQATRRAFNELSVAYSFKEQGGSSSHVRIFDISKPERLGKWQSQLPIENVTEDVESARKAALKKYGNDPLYAAFLNAKSTAEAQKAYKTLTSIRGQGAGANLRKIFRNESVVNETKFFAWYNKDKIEIEATSLWDAKQKAIKQLKVPKSKQGYLAVKSAKSMDSQDFRYENIQEIKIGKHDIGMGYMGNGLTIWDRNQEEHGDYKKIAHVDPVKGLKIYDNSVSPAVKKFLKKVESDEKTKNESTKKGSEDLVEMFLGPGFEMHERSRRSVVEENKFEVKYAKAKKGPIKVARFSTEKEAQEFLDGVRADGMNGMITKNNKPFTTMNYLNKE